jgi:hypothetical protein
MRSALAALPAAVAVCSIAGAAYGQSNADAQHEANRKYKPQPLNLHREQLGSDAYAADARKRMAAGDCDGALTSFDAALRTKREDPTLYRDRGLCHEKLGHPYPAIDDYREYLTDSPDAPDAEGFRTRLAQLEEETSGRAPSPSANDDTNVPPAMATASVSIGTAGAEASAGMTTRDKMQYWEREDDPRNVSMRRGKGFALAPFFSLHKWFFSGTSFGSSESWSESVGLQFRYQVGPAGGILLEAGYEHFNATSVDPFTIGGLTSQLAFEFRFPLDADYDNQLFLAPGFGYEHIVFSPSGQEGSAIATNAIVPRLRFGYRHMLGENASLDLSIDGGWSKWFVSNGQGATLSDSVFVGTDIAIVWGL